MKILFIVRTFPASPSSGPERYVAELARSLSRLGHGVHVLTDEPPSETPGANLLDGITVHRRSKEYPFFAYNHTLQTVLRNLPACQLLMNTWKAHGPFDVVAPHD